MKPDMQVFLAKKRLMTYPQNNSVATEEEFHESGRLSEHMFLCDLRNVACVDVRHPPRLCLA